MFAADPTAQEIGQALQLFVYAVLAVGGALGIGVAWKTLRADRPKSSLPVDREEFDRHIALAAAQNHARRDEANANALKLAVLDKTLENGLKRRVEILEERQEAMAQKVDRCAFILEQEFGTKHRGGQ